MHAKLALVALMLAHFIVSGRWLKGVDEGRRCRRRSSCAVQRTAGAGLVVVIWLVLAKPF
jgi:putative membrane protein